MRALVASRVVAHIARAVFKLTVQAPRWSASQRAEEIRRWARGVFSLFGIRLVVRGAPHPISGTLYAGNHVSWLDIYALLMTANLRFVAKGEVRAWPVIGWLAAQVGTQFIARDRRSDAHNAALAVSGLLKTGDNICIFPEGTTTDGHALRPFRAALFEPAAQGRAPVQPFAIRYLGPDGRVSDAAAFTGDMSLGASIWSLLGRRGLVCEISFLPVIETGGMNRRALALATERAVKAQLGVGIAIGSTAPIADAPDSAVLALR